MSIERFLLTNFVANLMLLAVSTRAVGRVLPGRVMGAALLGTLYALFAYASGKAWPRSPACALGCLIGMCLVACPPGSLRKRARLCASLAVCSGLAGGIQLALGQASPALFLAAMALYALFTGCRRSAREVREVRLRLEFSGGQVDVCALVDSGNRLHEPLSGLPVLLVERECLERALGRQNLDRLEAQGRPVRFRSLGHSGELNCLPARRLRIVQRGRLLPAGDVFVAPCEHTLSGEHQAIAPVGIFDEA